MQQPPGAPSSVSTLTSPPPRLTSPPLTLRQRPSTTTTTTTVQPTPPLIAPIPKIPLAPAPPPPPLPPFIDADEEDVFSRRLMSSLPVQQPQERVAEPSTAILIPPRSVLPRTFTLYKPVNSLVMTDGNPGDFVGLLRRMSLYQTYLYECYKHLESWGYLPEWSTILNKLYGRAKNRDDFLGFGKNGLPNHDQMGLFPIFVDSRGREYFEMPDHDGLVYMMRIPRHETKKHYELDFPQPNDKVALRPLGIPMFPFFWDSLTGDVRSISESQTLFRARVSTLAIHENTNRIYGKTLKVRIANTESFRDASCLVKIDPLDRIEFNYVFHPIQVLREEWNLNIVDLFKATANRAYNVDPVRLMQFVSYLQSTWLDAQQRWVREKTSLQ